MKIKEEDLRFLVVCTKSDYWFTKICIASIRYYYPEQEILLIKDVLGGDFDSTELEKYLNVSLLSYADNHFGISAAKMFFYCDEVISDDYYLVLDSDIILIGKIPLPEIDCDILVSAEYEGNPDLPKFYDLYFDRKKVEELGYTYPGYFFNAGQLICKRGFLHDHIDLIRPYFDFNKLPRWTRLDIFPKHDQSLMNFLLPVLETKNKLKIVKEDFMIWTGWEKAFEITIPEIQNRSLNSLLHYAGETRFKYLKKNKRPDIVYFFWRFYCSKIPAGKLKFLFFEIYWVIHHYFFHIGRTIKHKLSL